MTEMEVQVVVCVRLDDFISCVFSDQISIKTGLVAVQYNCHVHHAQIFRRLKTDFIQFILLSHEERIFFIRLTRSN